MRFWNLEQLRRDLAAGLTPRMALFYFAAVILTPELFDLGISLLLSLDRYDFEAPVITLEEMRTTYYERRTGIDGWPTRGVWSNALAIVILIQGLVSSYRRNGGNRGERFLERFIALVWVCGIRTQVFVMFPLILAIGIISLTTGDYSLNAMAPYAAFHAFATLFGVWRHIGRIGTDPPETIG